MKNAINNSKKIVFCVTPGRSGSKLLASLLSHTKNSTVVHEPFPHFQDYHRLINTYNPDLVKDFWEEIKIPYITQQETAFYIETSHLYLKGFYQYEKLNKGYKSAIILKRNKRDVALSLYNLSTIPGRTLKGVYWYSAPTDPHVILQIPKWENLSDYELCYWYTLEIEQKAINYKNDCIKNKIPFYEINFDELFEIDKMKSLINEIGLKTKPGFNFHYKRTIANKVNAKTNSKKRITFHVDELIKMENRVEQTISKSNSSI